MTAQRFYEPESLEAGSGYLISLSGETPVSWRRSLTPIKGLTELQQGRNLVAWLGPDDWTIEHVLQGIGRAFVRAEWGQNTYEATDAEESASLPPVQRGEALWIEVTRNVNWLQPAGVQPKFEFAGNASPALEAKVLRDSHDIFDHYAREFGVHMDGSSVTVYVAENVEALIVHLETGRRRS